ncbi:GNAT family N-acetyltransferase [Metabacillus indicus]|uniref:GNAT family N-acetyltransferase n=1 Tax=Metabacillus indicus TaxID=246786 RepID=UPI0039842DD8
MSSVVTKELAVILEESEIEALESRLTAIRNMEGNPMDVVIEKAGGTAAFSVKNIPGPAYNTVRGASVETLDDILRFYEEREISPRFEVTPAQSSPELFRSLSARGFSQSGFHTVLYGEAKILSTRPVSEISVRPLEASEFDLFGEIYTKGFGMPEFLKQPVAQNNLVLHGHEDWRFYLASMDGKAAGIGVLFMKKRIGTMAASAVLPEFRNRGVHRALLDARIDEAKQHGCSIIAGQASFGSGSQRNMERAGMKIAYTKALWDQVAGV